MRLRRYNRVICTDLHRRAPALALRAACLLLSLAIGVSCHKRGEPAPPVAAEAAPPATPLAEPGAASDTEPPEQYSTLPPGAFEEPVDGSAAEQPAAVDGDGAPEQGAGSPAARPDRSVDPHAGVLALTGVRIGMGTAEIRGRYPADSGWTYDQRFIADTGTGVILAKPNDVNARATEMTMLQSGEAVAFLRAVSEDSQVFSRTIGELSEALGPPTSSPPQWARQFPLFKNWHLNPDEQSRFWVNEQRQQLLTAGHNPNDRETVYMLLDLPRMEQVKAAMDDAKLGMPEEAPPVDPGWTPPPGAEVR